MSSCDGDEERNDNTTKRWLVVGDGDLSYSALIAQSAVSDGFTIVATVLESQSKHNEVYQHSSRNSQNILSASHQVRFEVDARRLESHFETEETHFDRIDFNFPHWPGKNNNKRNRLLLDSFLKSASAVLKRPDGVLRIVLCEDQSGMMATTLAEWQQSWFVPIYAAEHGLLLSDVEEYFEPTYDLSSHRGKDKPFHVGKNPQRLIFAVPNAEATKPIPPSLQLCCSHQLAIKLESKSSDDEKDDNGACPSIEYIVNTKNIFGELLINCDVPHGIQVVESKPRTLLDATKLQKCNVSVLVFHFLIIGETRPLTRIQADQIRCNLEQLVSTEWGLSVGKGGKMIGKVIPYRVYTTLQQAVNSNQNTKI